MDSENYKYEIIVKPGSTIYFGEFPYAVLDEIKIYGGSKPYEAKGSYVINTRSETVEEGEMK